MTDFEKEEFWKGLARLYDASVEQRRNISELGVKLTELGGKLTELTGVVTELTGVVNQLAGVAQSHEKRLDRTEVTVEAILEDLRRHREGRA